MYHYAKIHLCYNNYVNLHNYFRTNVFLYNDNMCILRLIEKIYTITVTIQLNVLEII